MAIKKDDFVEIEFTGKLVDEGLIFDTTDEKTAKDNEIYNEQQSYGPVTIIIGTNQVVSGLDKFLEGKEPGDYKVNLGPEEGFGKKRTDLLRLIPTKIFIKQQINPMPGLPINIDGLNGIIKTVSGGRCIVDFNHPFAGKKIFYEVKIIKIVGDEKEKIVSIVALQMKKNEFDVFVENGSAKIILKKQMHKEVQKLIEDMIKKHVGIKKVTFEEQKSAKEDKKSNKV